MANTTTKQATDKSNLNPSMSSTISFQIDQDITTQTRDNIIESDDDMATMVIANNAEHVDNHPFIDFTIDIIDNNTFKTILYFWFRTLFNIENRINVDIDNILLKWSHNYYFYVNEIVLTFYYYHHRWNGARNIEKFKNSCLYLIHSNGKIYRIQNCHDMQEQIMTNDLNQIHEQYVNDKYLKNKILSNDKCMQLISILVNLQINAKIRNSLSEGPGFCEATYNILIHSGKQIAEHHGFDIKRYTKEKQINFEPLVDFIKNEIFAYTERANIDSLTDIKYWDQCNGISENADIKIDNDKNILLCEKEEMYS